MGHSWLGRWPGDQIVGFETKVLGMYMQLNQSWSPQGHVLGLEGQGPDFQKILGKILSFA